MSKYIFEVVGTVDSPIYNTSVNDIKQAVEEALAEKVGAINERFITNKETQGEVTLTIDRCEVERDDDTPHVEVGHLCADCERVTAWHKDPDYCTRCGGNVKGTRKKEPPDVGAPINEDRPSFVLDLFDQFIDLAIEKVVDAAHEFLDEREPR